MENSGKCNEEHNAKLMESVAAQCSRQGVICVQHSGGVGGSSSSSVNNNNNNNCSMKMFENDLQQQQQHQKPQQQQQNQHQLQQVYKIAQQQQHHERGGIEQQQQKQQHNELYATREPSHRESSNSSSVHNLRENSGCCGERVCSASDTTTTSPNTTTTAISTAATTSNCGGSSGDGNEDRSNTAMACAARVEDEGGGATNDDNNTLASKLNGSGSMAAFPAMTHRPRHTHSPCAAAAVVHLELPPTDAATCYAAGAAADPTDDYEEEAACALGAISLTPPPPHLATPGGGGGGGNHSNRTSLNNSTENLSYSSDNYYPDDLILLDDEDVDAEEILSLNSDDCVYAYRGEGAEFDLAMQAIAGRSGAIGVRGADSGLVDDETDFLEMDFEPDPPSEVEYGLQQHAAAEAYCMQRDLCHLSGRHSANMMSAPASSASLGPGGGGSLQQQRRLFSSPIDREDISCAGSGVGVGNEDDDDDLLVCSSGPKPGLQSQLLMSKNFARITMHLDQIKGEAADCDLSFEHRTPNERSLSGSSRERDLDMLTPSETSHSLPNTLLTDYHRGEARHAPEHEAKTSPSKTTGAKPKRLSTHSTSSSQSSKNSSKSRTSLRSSAFTQQSAGCGPGSSGVPGNTLSGHFDERSVSCTEFRSIPPLSSAAIGPSSISVDADECGGVGLPLVVVGKPLTKNHQDDFSSYEEGCLDCLENEFLAKTIGKIMDPKGCPRCQRRRNFSSYPQPLTMYPTRGDFVQRRHSKSFMDSIPVSEQIFYPSQARGMGPAASVGGCDAEMMASMGSGNVVVAGCGSGGYRRKKKDFPLAKKVVHDVDLPQSCCGVGGDDKTTSIENDPYNYYKADQRRTICDTYNEQLLQSLLLTEPEIATISTININEDTLVQALDNFNITYNADLLRTNFKHYYASAAHPQGRNKDFKDMKHFLLHESKKYNNHPRLKRLIEMATGDQVNVDFQRDTNIVDTEMVFVKVSDVIYQWSRNKNLEVLKELDKRFADTNVLGKIANIIRQTQQRCSRSRPFPEFISIPQYYPSGFLTLTKKC